ncbi:hypothetical protein JIN85_06740 [Luteolibacter pohnpeiensis]|uniref:Uncharacterized protein n=1 Tax=Luteolibacter pohnpeiensis TaxID=454153 RepID=A0A934S9G1_9BACT|nr:hypothetical protein [Luteolibacter pohnpeiensis]MBK1882102.1 hypothetical protein [Luteolibacter pohnpeiensis]
MSTTDIRPGLLARHPWLFVVVAFSILLAAWSSLIVVAIKNSPQVIETSPISEHR